MSDDYEDLYGLSELDDGELRELIRQQLAAHPRVDPDDVEVEVQDGEPRRAEQPEAADDAHAARLAADGMQRGGANRTADTAEHLLRDTASELDGTGDMGEAIQQGYSYNPPTEPPQEGSLSKEDH